LSIRQNIAAQPKKIWVMTQQMQCFVWMIAADSIERRMKPCTAIPAIGVVKLGLKSMARGKFKVQVAA